MSIQHTAAVDPVVINFGNSDGESLDSGGKRAEDPVSKYLKIVVIASQADATSLAGRIQFISAPGNVIAVYLVSSGLGSADLDTTASGTVHNIVIDPDAVHS